MVELTKEEKKQLKATLTIFRLIAPKTQEIKALIKKIENTTDKDENIKLVKELQAKVEEGNRNRILKYAEARKTWQKVLLKSSNSTNNNKQSSVKR